MASCQSSVFFIFSTFSKCDEEISAEKGCTFFQLNSIFNKPKTTHNAGFLLYSSFSTSILAFL